MNIYIFWTRDNVDPNKMFTGTVKVQGWNLDEWAEKYNVSRIDYMDLDMQGAEGAVLKTCPKILKTVTFIHVEVSTTPLWSGIVLFPELKYFLESEGFTFIQAELEHNLHGNALFQRK